jgi:FkbM family methyltransferase
MALIESASRAAFERLSPYLRANLGWMRAKRRGDPELDLVDALAGRGMTVADIGASAGDFTARFAHLVGRTGWVHAFEPHPVHRPRLRRMAAARPQIVLHTMALSDHAGAAELHVPVIRSRPRYGLATLRPVEGDQAEAVLVEVRTLDEVLGDVPRLDLVKCDVEGHEAAVLSGAERTIARLRPILMIEIEQRHLEHGDVPDVLARVAGWGYEAQALFPDGLRPIEAFDVERDQLAHLRPGLDSMPPDYVNTFLFTPDA